MVREANTKTLRLSLDEAKYMVGVDSTNLKMFHNAHADIYMR